MKTFMVVSVAVILLFSGIAYSGDVPKADNAPKTISEQEKACFHEYRNKLMDIDAVYGQYGDTLRSMMASGRYSVCELVDLINTHFDEEKR